MNSRITFRTRQLKTRELLLDPQKSAEMCDTNYRIARRHYSFTNLEKYLQVLINISVGDF